MTGSLHPVEWVGFFLEAFGFAMTVLNLLALYANMAQTIQDAPRQMRDSLGNLRQQICEEREALVHQAKQTRAHHGVHRRPNGGGDAEKRGASPGGAPSTLDGTSSPPRHLPLTYSDQTLSLHYMTLKDLWLQFKALEQPFLVDAADAAAAEALARGDSWHTEDFEKEAAGSDNEDQDEDGGELVRQTARTMARNDSGGRGRRARGGDVALDWATLYRCDFGRRFVWWRVKPDVKKLADRVVKVMLRRMEREVTQTRLMVMQERGVEVWGASTGSSDLQSGGGARAGAGGSGGGAATETETGILHPAAVALASRSRPGRGGADVKQARRDQNAHTYDGSTCSDDDDDDDTSPHRAESHARRIQAWQSRTARYRTKELAPQPSTDTRDGGPTMSRSSHGSAGD